MISTSNQVVGLLNQEGQSGGGGESGSTGDSGDAEQSSEHTTTIKVKSFGYPLVLSTTLKHDL